MGTSGDPRPRSLVGLPTLPEPTFPFTAWAQARGRRNRRPPFSLEAIIVWFVIVPACWVAAASIVWWAITEL